MCILSCDRGRTVISRHGSVGYSRLTCAGITANTALRAGSGKADYKSCLIQQDHHLLTVLRYVERNALAGKLVTRAEDWRWGSLNWRIERDAPIDLYDCTDRPTEVVDRFRESAHDIGRA